jgi:hypothetical protein
MHRPWKNALYTTDVARDQDEGWCAMRLHREARGQSAIVATIVFWDAEGQFAFETSGTELPLEVVEEFIAEARATIKTE